MLDTHKHKARYPPATIIVVLFVLRFVLITISFYSLSGKHKRDGDHIIGRETISKKKLKNIFQLASHFASHKETLLTMFATEGLGLHHILMFLSFQSAQAGYCNLMRPRERWYDIQLNSFSEEAERYMKHDVSLTDSSWRHVDLA